MCIGATGLQTTSFADVAHWFRAQHSGVLSSAICMRPVPLGGNGLIASEDMECNTELGIVPLGACLCAQAALDDESIGSVSHECLSAYGFKSAAELIVTAALLVQARYGEADAKSKWGIYANSLPWGDGAGNDPLARHPILRGQDVGRRLSFYRAAASDVCEVLSGSVPEAVASDAVAMRAVLLVATRSMDLSPSWGNDEAAQAAASATSARWHQVRRLVSTCCCPIAPSLADDPLNHNTLRPCLVR